uniref:Putative secreted protein n=1 Tax=Anopheles marajoara TaxID=58244 RepID=A0A2M4CG59_9DIPT
MRATTATFRITTVFFFVKILNTPLPKRTVAQCSNATLLPAIRLPTRCRCYHDGGECLAHDAAYRRPYV